MKKNKILIAIFILFLVPIFSYGQDFNKLTGPGLSPDSPFYFFDRLGEWARMNLFTFREKAKIRIKIQYAEERLVELEKISKKKNISPNAINKAKDRLNKFSDEAMREARKLEKDGKKLPSDIEEKLNFLAKRQEDVLNKVMEQVPEAAKPVIERVIEESKERFEKRIEKKIETPKIKIETPQLKIEAVPLSKIREITITDNGFEPSKIEAEKGMIVRWYNKSSRESWPASAFHPTHAQYPEKGGCIGSAFDACRGIPPNEAYEFVFNVAGTWSYHDHLGPGSQGVVIVK